MERWLSVLTILCLLILPFSAKSQEGEVFTAIKTVDQGRYVNVEGEAYFFAEFEPGIIIGASGQIYNEAALNYNGITKMMEVKRNNTVSELRDGTYLKIIIRSENLEYAFMRGIHSKFGIDLVGIPYDGNHIKLIAKFTAVADRNSSVLGNFSKLNSQTDYYIISDGRISPISLNKKKVLAILGSDKVDLNPYIEENKLKLRSLPEVVQLLAYYESQLL